MSPMGTWVFYLKFPCTRSEAVPKWDGDQILTFLLKTSWCFFFFLHKTFLLSKSIIFLMVQLFSSLQVWSRHWAQFGDGALSGFETSANSALSSLLSSQPGSAFPHFCISGSSHLAQTSLGLICSSIKICQIKVCWKKNNRQKLWGIRRSLNWNPV